MKKLLLLHGALGSASQMAPLAKALEGKNETFSFNFSGHGGAPFFRDFGVPAFTEEALGFLDANGIDQADIFGYSMGGYVAVNLARQAPERVGKIVTLATRFDWTPEIAMKEAKMLDPEKIEAKVPSFAELLRERHAPNDWKEVLHKTADMMLELGGSNLLDGEALKLIRQPVLVCIGDQDQMVSLQISRQVADTLADGQLLILENTPHPFEKINVEVVAKTISGFLESR